MTMMRTCAAAIILVSCSALTARTSHAQDAPRPNEDDMFGGGSDAPSQPTPEQQETSKATSRPEAFEEKPSEQRMTPRSTDPNLVGPNARPSPERDAAELAAPQPERDAFASGEAIDNPLTVGGLYYQQLIFSRPRNTAFTLSPIDMPLQFDGFLDVRPNSRLRGFVDMRLLYDPARDIYGNATAGESLGNLQTSSTSAAPTGFNFTGVQVPDNPQAVLNEAWIKFDIMRTVFVTAGKQHVKWGASRFWNPTDFLNPTKRDPLTPYDLRLGATMLKLELPLEASQTNFYAVALFDNPSAASTVGQLGGALRAETVLGPAEIGVDLVWRKSYSPILGLDFSAPVGPLDVYLEADCYLGRTPATVQIVGDPTDGGDITNLYKTRTRAAGTVQVSGGAHYDFAWLDNRQATIGAEYFYNQMGYSNPEVYPLLIFLGSYVPFYTGRHYGALYATAEGPDAEKHTSFTLSVLSNLSDQSYIARMDFSWRILTYLTFGAYVDGHWGTVGGEFNFSLDTRGLKSDLVLQNGQKIPPFVIEPTLFDVGTSLRLSF